MFYERTALSRNKVAMLRKGEKPKEEDKVPPEEALIRHLESFLMELGGDFAFVGRQRRLRPDENPPSVGGRVGTSAVSSSFVLIRIHSRLESADMKLVIATRNKHKLEEIRSILSVPGLEIVSALDYPEVPDVVEDGTTFEANAIKKAVTLAKATGLWALADDSGLEVDALGGKPGVYSARYAGEPASYPANNSKLLKNLETVKNRRARFRCVIALAGPDGEVRTVDGRCEGTIGFEERGDRGFGYDPLFIPDGHTRTFAELDSEAKHAISHRGRALRTAQEAWGGLLRRR
jgi:XTP/dITP diphosphohydrolase